MFKKVLVANRGEIAVRVIRACRRLGLQTVAIYSEADRESLHLRLADEAWCIGPGPSAQSYLCVEAILSAARLSGAQAVHPGYGFLSENSRFARACREAGLVFIGPTEEAIEKSGNKAVARVLAKANGVPVVPGTEGAFRTLSQAALQKLAASIGYPLMIKAAAGGGGRGIRLTRDPRGLLTDWETAGREAQAAFGDGSLYLERYLERPRHVEIQIAADLEGRVLAFPERDCSLQRKHQKLVEESPSPAVSPRLRRSLQEAACRVARAVRYSNLGTVEFLLSPEGKFYFMEVNSRLQVEHPVTEMVTGIDLVCEQIRIAQGRPMRRRPVKILGHAIEHRINAENPERNFSPSPGRVSKWRPPAGQGVRVDTHVYEGYCVPSYYDSLIAKLICCGKDRRSALARARNALEEFQIAGIDTTLSLHRRILECEAFQRGKVHTGFVEQEFLNHTVPMDPILPKEPHP
ncbi:MAG: acetyl-CoA carboxylase biotin carboxylase subunit [Elusimicrobia bacterium]|nr:acetyl-CoA carboxylase biotin carboxylase subunit [Elusimicrobiota bacterium]